MLLENNKINGEEFKRSVIKRLREAGRERGSEEEKEGLEMSYSVAVERVSKAMALSCSTSL